MVEAAIWNAAIEAAAGLVTVMGAPIGSTPAAVAAAIRALKRAEPCARRADCDPELSNSPDPPRGAIDPLISKGNNHG